MRERKQQYQKSRKGVPQLLFQSPEQAVCHPLGRLSKVSQGMAKL